MSPYRSAAPDTQLRNARRTWVRACALAQRLLKVRRLTEMWALSACTALLAVCALAFWLDAQRYDVLSIQAGRAAAIIVTAACVACLMWALLRPVRAGWLLTRIESEDASFDGLLVSAMELQDLPSEGAHQSEALTARLFEQAAVRIASDHPWQTRERRRCKQAGVVAVAPLLVAATLGMVGPDWLIMGVSLLINQTSATQAINPYSVTVEPGDVKLLEGDDLVIRAHSIGFSPDITEPGAVSLFVREHAQAPWQVREMNPDASGSGEGSDTGHTFHAILLSLSTGFQYRAEVEGLESPIHRVTVIPRPKLQKIGLDYRYPIHTGAAPKTVEDGGDIAAVKGTMVRVRVTADSPARAASLQFASAATVPLRLQDGEWVGTVQLSQNDSYRVELASALGGDLRAASREFSVQALVDTLPKVAIARPGKDAKVSSIEEVSIEVHASDDVAVRDLHLLMSVNGAPEQEVLIGGEASQIRNGIHTVYLEEMALNAGDLIAFHARARDSSVTARTVESDIFFLEVRPYERRYRRGGGGGGGGRGGANRSMLAAQQRTLVIALFKMVRDEPKLSEHQKVSQVETLTAAQLRIRERVEAITRRLGQRRVFDGEPGYQQMAKELPKASVAMA
ncbi:MAG: hypothetical protein HOI95_10300, partial [Chromatiales bacterium]|nr:hypothetical protein [Chromatiales bacterium]